MMMHTWVSGGLFAETNFKILDHMYFFAKILAFHWVTWAANPPVIPWLKLIGCFSWNPGSPTRSVHSESTRSIKEWVPHIHYSIFRVPNDLTYCQWNVWRTICRHYYTTRWYKLVDNLFCGSSYLVSTANCIPNYKCVHYLYLQCWTT